MEAQIIEGLLKRIDKLEDEIKSLQTKRVTQAQVLPDVIKERHVGEGVRFIRAGLEADLPTEGEPTASGQPFYWCTDSFKLKIWTGTAWKSVTLS